MTPLASELEEKRLEAKRDVSLVVEKNVIEPFNRVFADVMKFDAGNSSYRFFCPLREVITVDIQHVPLLKQAGIPQSSPGLIGKLVAFKRNFAQTAKIA